MPTPIIIHGAAGRMGRRLLALSSELPALYSIAAAVDQQPVGLRELGLERDGQVQTALPALPGAVVIDFSHHACFASVCAHCARHRMPLVSGTTGIEPGALEQGLAQAAVAAPALHALNMSLGVNLLFRIAAQVAAVLGPDYDCEIVEAHHNQKKDAPSGTALGLADAICAATGRSRHDLVDGRSGMPGPRRKGEIGMHALRLGDVVGDHSAWFVGNGERITLGHQAHNRDIFARGALRAAAVLAGKPPGRYRMADVLGI